MCRAYWKPKQGPCFHFHTPCSVFSSDRDKMYKLWAADKVDSSARGCSSIMSCVSAGKWCGPRRHSPFLGGGGENWWVRDRKRERESKKSACQSPALSAADPYLTDTLKNNSNNNHGCHELKHRFSNLGVSLYLWYGIVLTFEQHFYLHLKYVSLVCKNTILKSSKSVLICYMYLYVKERLVTLIDRYLYMYRYLFAY